MNSSVQARFDDAVSMRTIESRKETLFVDEGSKLSEPQADNPLSRSGDLRNKRKRLEGDSGAIPDWRDDSSQQDDHSWRRNDFRVEDDNPRIHREDDNPRGDNEDDNPRVENEDDNLHVSEKEDGTLDSKEDNSSSRKRGRKSSRFRE